MTRWSEKLRQPTVLLGDFNIAPLECDVWNHKALLDVVSHTPVEVDLLTALRQSHDWIDLGRQFVPAPEKLFTWWSYRARDWKAKSFSGRSEEHTSELQSLMRISYAVFCLKKKHTNSEQASSTYRRLTNRHTY